MNSALKVRLLLLGIFTLSLLLQGIFITNFHKSPVEADAGQYYDISQSILYHQASLLDGEINIRRPPGYPFFLAGVFYLFGNRLLSAQLSQALLIALTCVIIFYLGRLIFNERIGLISAALLAMHPVLIPSSFYLLSEALALFMVTLFSCLLTLAIMRRKALFFVLSGIVVALTVLVNPVLIVFPLFFSLVLLLRYGLPRAARYSLLILVPFLLIVSLWTARNFRLSGLFVPVSLGGELELWNGSYIPGRGHSDHPNTVSERNRLWRAFRERNASSEDYARNGKGRGYYLFYLDMRDFLKEGRANILAHPLGYIAMFPRKLAYLYIGSYCYLYGIAEPFSVLVSPGAKEQIKGYAAKLALKSLVLLASIITFLFFVLGMFRNYKNPAFLAVFSILFYWTLFFCIFSPITRYSIPVIPLLVLTALSGTKLWLAKR